jgi:LPXTG-site transpeptidase (sortase) family protein
MRKRNFILLFTGIALMLIGMGNTWMEYRRMHNPLDQVADVGSGSGQAAIPYQFSRPHETQIPVSMDHAYSLSNGMDGIGSAASNPVQGQVPDRLVIPAIRLDAPIIPITYRSISLDDQMYNQWLAPNQYAVGWQDTSALLGLPGNSVFDGHHNSFGKVFKDLVDLSVGDSIDLYSGNRVFHYQVIIKLLVPERDQLISTRLANARWIAPTSDERITLITCWPASSNTHRVIVVAYPVSLQ